MKDQHVDVSADPIPKEVLDYCRSVTTTEKQFEQEREAYVAFCEKYSKERDPKKRIVMEMFLQYLLFSKVHGMTPSYALTSALSDALNDEAKAKRAMYPQALHEEIADILTSSTYTVGRGKSTNWTMHTASQYSQFDGDGRRPFSDWTAGEILGSYVKFGSHHFSVGKATQRILGVLEERYGIDFEELEKQRKSLK
ncbi:hypothetical protein QBK93_07620 [Rhizobium leguminosarum]|uniref:hypothetical protein n=1 Tax=Rhizobium leguminosarum TaxID=384 RepID=UPI0024A8CE60|nr:hypothetical protein [Rhizobium leguminosarum]MDI5924548.1 hypothetical protein [Rhizobium leguminosarum]